MSYPQLQSESVTFRELFQSSASVIDNGGVITGTPTISAGATFDGSTDKITYALLTGMRAKTVDIVLQATTTTEEFLDLDGGTHTVEASSGTITATGFSSPTIYVDGAVSSTLTTAETRITITTATAIDLSAVVLGAVGASFFDGVIKSVTFYETEKTAEEITDIVNGTTFPELDQINWKVDLPLRTNYVSGSDTVTSNKGNLGGTLTYADGTTSADFPTQLLPKGVRMDGTSDHMQMAANSSLPSGANLTLVACIKVDDTSVQNSIMFRGNNGASGSALRYYAYVDTNGRMTFGSKVASGSTFSFFQSGNDAIQANKEHVVVCTTDSSASGEDRIRVWIDGIEDTTSITWNGSFASDNEIMYIGRDSDGGLDFGGDIFVWRLGAFTATSMQAREITNRINRLTNN